MRTVKDLLKNIKDTSEIVVDLAYSAILFDSEDIAEEVLDLENVLSDLLNQIRIVTILSARRVDEAESVSTLLKIAGAAQKIGSAAGDIALLVLRGFKLPKDVINLILRYSEETVVKAVVSENSEIANKTLGEVRLHTRTGMRVIAIKREFDWIFNPDRDTKILKGDVLFARGDISGKPYFYELVTGERIEIPVEDTELELEEIDRAVDILIEMKDLSELAVDLSYSSLIYENEDIANEVFYLEEKVDNLKFELKHWVLKSSKKVGDDKLRDLIAILELATASEYIADSAREIAEIVSDKMDLHPVFFQAMKEADEVLVMFEVGDNCELDGKTLGDARVETRTGMHIMAIKRRNRWISRPKAGTKLESGDMIIAKGTREGMDLLRKMCVTKLTQRNSSRANL
ncbi:potassium channel family protein [Archaeoglobus sulfaticallidus]|nr:potassium channel family protein [Archaeoglobus sulfaticallidus]